MTKYFRIDAGDGEETTITEKELRDRLDGYYKDIDLAVQAIDEGETLRTDWAFYKKVGIDTGT